MSKVKSSFSSDLINRIEFEFPNEHALHTALLNNMGDMVLRALYDEQNSFKIDPEVFLACLDASCSDNDILRKEYRETAKKAIRVKELYDECRLEWIKIGHNDL